MEVSVERVPLPLKRPFSIATGASTDRTTILLRLAEPGGREGLGEGTCLHYLSERPEEAEQALRGLGERFDRLGCFTEPLMGSGDAEAFAEVSEMLLPRASTPRAARAALDLALLDLVSKRSGRSLAHVLGLPAPRPVDTAFTIGVNPVEERLVELELAQAAGARLLKVKLGGRTVEDDLRALRALRARYAGVMVVDANGGWSVADARWILPRLDEIALDLVEQPLKRGHLEEWPALQTLCETPLVADEDVLDTADLDVLEGKVGGINVKVAKAGGLSEAARLAKAATERGWKLMVGCMIESSAATTAASWLSGFDARFDLDGPLWLAADPVEGLRFEDGRAIPPSGPGLGIRRRS